MTPRPATRRVPAAYSPFAPVFARLSDPLRRMIEGQLEQFERLVPVLRATEMARSGEFEGLGGLTHRGEISHIVQSELLLRTEAPLEFLRRLAEGETMFLEKQYADPGARQLYRAMVSVGPGLLGHGRIVALAGIVFLARIAAERGAAFHWCFLPRGDGAVWFDEVSVNTVKRFLRAASFREMDRDDRAAADEVWGTIVPGALGGQHPTDWTIGCNPLSRADTRSAVLQADNVLAFTVSPPGGAEPRTAELTLRRGGRESARFTVPFTDDRSCVEALREPFASGRIPAVPAALRGDAIPTSSGWEPDHLALANMQTRLIHLVDGLLVLGQATRDGFRESYLVRLPEGGRLIGVRVGDAGLWVLVGHDVGGEESLTFVQYRIAPGVAPRRLLTRSIAFPWRHLSRDRPLSAISPLNRHNGADFYSAAGEAYHLDVAQERTDVAIAPLHQAARTLHAIAQCRVTLPEEQGTPMLQVVKNHRTMLDDYLLPPGNIPDRFHGIVYSLADRSLTYSVEPGEWIVPVTRRGGADRAAARFLSVARHELPLMVKTNTQGGIIARLWSDARYGGDGLVRWVRDDSGRTVNTSEPLDLGADAGTMARLILADDGLWGLTLDGEDRPAHLLRYYRNKREQCFVTRRFDVADLAAQAIRIDLEVGDATD